MIGLTALRAAIDLGAVPPDPVLFRLPGLPVAQRELYLAAGASVRDLPWSLAERGAGYPDVAGLDDVLDLRDFAFDQAFRAVAMVDYFLAALGVPPASVPAASKRNVWLARAVTPVPPPWPAGYVLVCPDAAIPLRVMPEQAHRAILAKLADTGLTARSQRELPLAASLAELCGWVAHAAAVVATDTAMVHLADAFSVPCLAVFTTHRPEWRARDYPFCVPVHRPLPGLPESLEFARDEGDIEASRAVWAGADRWLAPAVDRFLEAASIATGRRSV